MLHIDIRTTVRGSVPRIPFEDIARSILPAQYELSLVVCGDTLARRINTENRKKTYSPNVLSLPIDTHEGEIFLNLRKAEREAKQEDTSTRARLALLYVHGLYHLKGLNHGPKMEALEQKTLKQFNLT